MGYEVTRQSRGETATALASAASRVSKTRPWIVGIPSRSKYAFDTTSEYAVGSFSGFGSSRPSTDSGEPPLTGAVRPRCDPRTRCLRRASPRPAARSPPGTRGQRDRREEGEYHPQAPPHEAATRPASLPHYRPTRTRALHLISTSAAGRGKAVTAKVARAGGSTGKNSR